MITEQNKLPNGWNWVKLGKYVHSVKGKKPKAISKEKTKDYSIPYVNIKAFEQKVIDEYTNGEGCVMCDDGDFLMVWDGSRSGYVGKGIKGALGSTLVKLDFPDIENNYAYYFLQSKFLDINTRAKGVGIPHVDPNILWNYDLLIPPKPVQQAIVSKIEELFSELDKGIENLCLAQQQLKMYRQAVLKWAFEGKLINKNVKEGELPEGWKKLKLREIAKDISDGDHQAPPKSNSGIPFITISNVNKETNKIDFSDTFSVNKEYYANLKINRKPLKGDVLYTVTGSFGIPILIDFDKEFCFQRHIGLIRPLETTNQKWLFYLLQSPSVFNQAKSTATGTAQKTVALNSLRNFEIPFCIIEEQIKIVQEIESRLSVADKMEESITQSLQQAEALRQSILKKAFEGKLKTN
jgi:type I restriction enzyme S subunit